MKKLLLIILLCSYSTFALAVELEENVFYRTKVGLSSIIEEVIVKDAAGVEHKTEKEYVVGAKSKFEVFNTEDKSKYQIRFTKIYYDKENDPEGMVAKENIEYSINKISPSGTAIKKKVVKSFDGLVSGPLIVPFKYRLGNKSLSPAATIGYYAGYGTDLSWLNIGFAITPFFSAGLTNISVSKQTDDETSETETIITAAGFTWAVGLLFQNWDSVNIGIVYGQDRIGDQDWEFEGDGWWSVSVGWKM